MRMRLSLLAVLALPLALAACGGGGGRLATTAPYGRTYDAPGPAEDPWGPYIHEASARFAVPETWIRVVMRQESGGHEYRNGQPIVSTAGAMGLMQLMPATYAMLRDRYSLGNDPYDPHDNIIAGTGYIADLYHRYGSPAFLAAYDWGPRHVDMYLAGQARLPYETANYLASVAPLLGGGPMTGPFAVYAQGGRAPSRMYAANYQRHNGCVRDVDAAYDPSHPCVSAGPQQPSQPVQVAEASPTVPNTVLWGQTPASPAPAPAYAPPPRHSGFALIASAQADTLPMSATGTGWGVQVGAFPAPDLARSTAENARAVAPTELASARTVVGQAVHPDGAVWYRARLVGISHPAADTACTRLSAKRWPCLTVPPGG
jgi:hypothetical protein